MLYIGIVNFLEPTFLLIGEAHSFRWLADQLTMQYSFTLEQVSGKTRAILRFIPVTSVGCLSRLGNVFEWKISLPEARQVEQQLRELASSQRPAHAYLDPIINDTGVQIVASVGEYEPTRVFNE